MTGAVLLVAIALGWSGLYLWAAVSARSVAPHPFFKAPSPWVIAHRGGAALRPENTLIAFEHARRLGVDVLELDVRQSRDGALVVIHDAAVDRTTDGSGAVAEMDLDALRALNAGARFDGEHAYGARIPLLEDVLKRFPNARLNVEMKVDGIADAVCELLRTQQATERVLVASASAERMARFRERCPMVATSATFDEALRFWLLAQIGIAGSAPAEALQIPVAAGVLPLFGSALLDAAAARGMVVQVFTVNDAAQMRQVIEAGAHGVMTDRPDVLTGRVARE